MAGGDPQTPPETKRKQLPTCQDCGLELSTYGKLHEHESRECPKRLARLVAEGRLTRG